MQFGPVACIMTVFTSGVLFVCSTVRAQEKVQHRTQTLSVQELFRDQDNAGRLNQSTVTRRRSDVQDDADSGITTIGTLPAWVFPSFVQAALEPSFGEHFSIIGVNVPEARLQCIPDLDSEEYRRLIEVRNQMWGTIIREFPEIDDWLVGPEPSYSVFVDCKGVPLSVGDLVRFFVDTLEELHPVITAENSDAQVIAHFLGDPWIPIVVRGERVQPSSIRSRMQTEIASRNGLAADYYDQLAEELDSSLVADRSPERIPPVTDSSESDSSDEESSPTRSADASNSVSGWNSQFTENFDIEASANSGGFVGVYNNWKDWKTNTNRVHLTDNPVDLLMNERLQIRLEEPTLLTSPKDYSIGGGITTGQDDENYGVDVVPDEDFDTSASFLRKDLWTAFSEFYATNDDRSGPAHAAVFLRVRDRLWNDEEGTPVPDQTRFGAFVFGRNTTEGCCNVWCGALEIYGDDIYAPDHPADSEDEGKTHGKLKLLHLRVEESATSETEGETEEGSESEQCSGTNLLWDDSNTLYQLRILEEKRHSYLFGFVVYWKAEVWKHPTVGNPILVGARDWTSEWEIRILHGIEIPALGESKLAIGLGPLESLCKERNRMEGETLGQCMMRIKDLDNPDIGIDVERTGTQYWIYPD